MSGTNRIGVALLGSILSACLTVLATDHGRGDLTIGLLTALAVGATVLAIHPPKETNEQ